MLTSSAAGGTATPRTGANLEVALDEGSDWIQFVGSGGRAYFWNDESDVHTLSVPKVRWLLLLRLLLLLLLLPLLLAAASCCCCCC